MDGNLNETTLNYLMSYCPNKQYLLENNVYKNIDKEINILPYNYKSKNANNLIIEHLDEAIKKESKTVLQVSSYSIAQRLQEHLLKQGVNKSSIAFYHGKNYFKEEDGTLHNDLKTQDFQRIDEVSKNTQFLIYTGTLTCGVSINIEFD